MDFVFQGFQSTLPVWGYFLFFVGTTILSWWSYRHLSTVHPAFRYGLIALRSLVFFILIVLLVNPFFKAESTYYEKPRILVLLDNSASTTIEKNDYKGLESYKRVLNQLNFNDSSRVNFRFFELDQNISPSHPESLDHNGSGTNLYNAYEVVYNQRRDLDAAILISDGIFNQGRDPAYEAGNIDIPLFTIALGDTSQQKDIIVKSVVSNTTGYVNTRHPVEVTVLNNGFARQPFEVQVKKGDRILDTQTVTPQSDVSSHTLDFDLNLEEEGLQQFTVTIPSLSEEWTQANNTQPFSVDVLDEKQRILSLAFEIYPDVGMLRSNLLRDENTKLIPRTWLGGDRFIEGSMDIGSDSLDLVILHGYPANGVPESLRNQVSSILERVPSLVISTPRNSFSALESQTEILLPVRQSGSETGEPVNLMAAVEPNAHPVMELPPADYQRMPSITAPIYSLIRSRGTVLFTSSFQGSDTNQPLITVNQTGNLRQTQITGYGWYKIAQSPNAEDREFNRQLFSNLVSWTATKPDERMLDIQPAQTVFTGEQPIVLNAFLTNESGETESEAEIEISISGKDIRSRNYSMNNTGNGQYRLQLNALPEGIYNFDATARKGNRTIDSTKGEFSVSSSNIEYVNTRRNDPLLQQMAQRSGGKFYPFDQIQGFWQDLDDKGLLDMEQKIRDHIYYPYQHSFWFIMVITFLAAEWFIRKYLALP